MKVANATKEQHNHYQYRCQLTASCGTFHSNTVKLTVNTLPDITHPAAKTLCPGVGTDFQVTAPADVTAYQWQQQTNSTSTWANISEAGAASLGYSDFTTNSLKINKVTSEHSGYQYRCQLTSTLCSTIFSNPAALTVTQPAISSPPDQSLCSGQGEAAFKVSVTTHAGCITGYQWQQRASTTATWTDITEGGTSPKYSGSATPELKVSGITAAHNGYQYRCRLSLAGITQNTEAAGLYVDPALEITSHPKDSTIREGNPNADFRVRAKGINLKYQWQVSTDQEKTWTDIREAGANPTYADWDKDVLRLNNIPPSANDYRYRCNLSGTSCSGTGSKEVTSKGAKLKWEVSTGIVPSAAVETSLYAHPNPASDRLNAVLHHSVQGETVIVLYNLVGQKIWSATAMKNGEALTKEISIGHLPNGLYILKMVVESAAPLQTKVLIAH